MESTYNNGVTGPRTVSTGPRPLHVIADDILNHWTECKGNSRDWSMPYIRAMRHLITIDGMYGSDDAREIVIRFLGNAQGWRGPDARRVKQELKEMLKR